MALWQALKNSKKYWLVPLIVILVLFGVLLILVKSSSMAPFVYSLF